MSHFVHIVVADALRLSVFERHLDSALNNMLQFSGSPEVVRQLDLMVFEAPVQLNYPVLP